jgi:hypothetical protein
MDYLIPSLVIGGIASYMLMKTAEPPKSLNRPNGDGLVTGVMSGKLATVLPRPLDGYESRPFVADYNTGHVDSAYDPPVMMASYSSFETDPQNPQPPPPIAGMAIGRTITGRVVSGVSKTEGLGIFQEINPPEEEDFVGHDGNPAPKVIEKVSVRQKVEQKLEAQGFMMGQAQGMPDQGFSGASINAYQGFGGIIGNAMPMQIASGGFGGLLGRM